jgi:hypothetical protein
VLEAVVILLEFPSPSRRIFIGSHSLPPSLVRRIGPSVSPLLCHFLLSPPFEAKLILIVISPTIATMESHKLRLRLRLGLLTYFSPLSFSTGFFSLAFSLSFAKNTFPEVLTNLIGFWKSFVCGGNTGGARIVSGTATRVP